MAFLFRGEGVSSFFKELCPPRGRRRRRGCGGGGGDWQTFSSSAFFYGGVGGKRREGVKNGPSSFSSSSFLQCPTARKMGGGGGGRSMRFLRRIGASEAKRSREVPLPAPLYIHLRKAKKMSLPKTRSGTEFRQPFFPTAFL